MEVCLFVHGVQVTVFKITTPNFGFSTGSWVGRSIFLDFSKKAFFRIFFLKKTYFFSILCPNKVNIWYYWVRITKFGTVVTGVSVINNIKKNVEIPPPPGGGGGGSLSLIHTPRCRRGVVWRSRGAPFLSKKQTSVDISTAPSAYV